MTCYGQIEVLEGSLWRQCGEWHVAKKPVRKIGLDSRGKVVRGRTEASRVGQADLQAIQEEKSKNYRWTERKRKLDHPR